MITQERVKELFEYRDGKLYWRLSPRANVKSGDRAGSRNGKIYWKTKINKKCYMEHRLIFLMLKGWLPKEIDHISDELTDEGIKDNSIENLQPSNHSRNNQKSAFTRGVSKYRGVVRSRTVGKWMSHICKNYHYYHLGNFQHEEEAARAYDSAAKKLYGEYCFLNFPEER